MIQELVEQEVARTAKLFESISSGSSTDYVVKVDKEREEQSKTDYKNIQIAIASGNCNKIAGAIATVNEENRIRRDISIINMSHKDIIMSGLRGLYSHKVKLEKERLA